LQDLERRAKGNGVNDLKWLDSAEVAVLEPQLRCAAGLFSPATGIIDVHEYLSALHADIEAADGQVVMRTTLVSARVTERAFQLQLSNDDDQQQIECKSLVNAAGLSAVSLLPRIHGYPANRWRQAYFAKGNYFVLQGARPFRHLVYPMPNEAGLGVHATLDLDGTTRFGPDVEWVEQLDYRVDPSRGDSFYTAIREYWPALRDGALQPGYAGIRPKLVDADSKAGDFEIELLQSHGIPGLVNLLGIESPGLTSSLAIAALVADALQ
jgi:L-2-hydroxyglutarate oxidase LhgO